MTKKTKIKLNASKRKLATKVFERHYQNEDNIYKQEYSSCRQKVDFLYPQAHERMKVIIEAHYPTADIQNLAEMQKRYNLDIVNPDACFHVRTKLGRTQKDWEGREQEVFDDCHVNFQLFGGLSGNGYSERGGYNFAVAYYHQHLTQKGCIPQIHVMQKGKKDNPYLTQKKDENIAELGGLSTNPENLNGLSLQWHDKYKLNVIMRSHYCNSRYLTCDRSDYDFFKDFLIAKENLVDAYTNWQENIYKRVQLVEATLKNYNNFDQVKELADNQKIDITEHDIEVESTSLTIFNPVNVSSMLDDLKPKAKETKAEKIARVLAYQTGGVANG